jgi:hypothetical protein
VWYQPSITTLAQSGQRAAHTDAQNVPTMKVADARTLQLTHSLTETGDMVTRARVRRSGRTLRAGNTTG